MILSLAGRHGAALIKYAFIGGASALVEWSLFWVLLGTLHYMLAAVIAFVVASFVNYVLCIKTMFTSKTHSAWKDLVMVYVASLIALVVNLSTLALLVRQFGFDPMASKIAGTGAAFLFNFASRRFLIFDPSRALPSYSAQPTRLPPQR